MEEEFIPFELAKKLKEKGFQEKCPKCKREMTVMKNKQTGRTAYHCPYCGEHKEV